ncbi:MAG TPA: hypothetical protein VK837_02865 [Longimicrobiales bacterium]|nr:hypothetical protein [Longimicrobiales bacterium]
MSRAVRFLVLPPTPGLLAFLAVLVAFAPAVGAPGRLAAQAPVPAVDVRGHGVDERLVRRVEEAASSMRPFPALPVASPPPADGPGPTERPDSGSPGSGPRGTASPRPPVRVDLAGSEAELARLTGGRIPEWGAGIAIPGERRIVLPALGSRNRDPAALQRTLRHELAHIALHDALSPARIPRWFDEGYARWAAGEWDAAAEWRLRLAFALDRAPSLDSLALSWPSGTVRAEVAYLLATSAVGYLLEEGGVEGLATFLSRWQESASLDRAMRRTYGRTLGQFEHDWQRRTRSRYGWAALLSHATVFWAFAALLLGALYVLRRRRNAARRAAMTEPPDRPAYWLGEDAWRGVDRGPVHPGGEVGGENASPEGGGRLPEDPAR